MKKYFLVFSILFVYNLKVFCMSAEDVFVLYKTSISLNLIDDAFMLFPDPNQNSKITYNNYFYENGEKRLINNTDTEYDVYDTLDYYYFYDNCKIVHVIAGHYDVSIVREDNCITFVKKGSRETYRFLTISDTETYVYKDTLKDEPLLMYKIINKNNIIYLHTTNYEIKDYKFIFNKKSIELEEIPHEDFTGNYQTYLFNESGILIKRILHFADQAENAIQFECSGVNGYFSGKYLNVLNNYEIIYSNSIYREINQRGYLAYQFTKRKNPSGYVNEVSVLSCDQNGTVIATDR